MAKQRERSVSDDSKPFKAMKNLIAKLFRGGPRPSGVVIGAKSGAPLIDTSMNPVAVLGPCRSGKTSAVVVPTLLTWRESAVVIDVHGERFGITEHWRRTGAKNQVRRLAFGDPASPDTFNFLDAIPRGTSRELLDIEALAEALLCARPGEDGALLGRARMLLCLFIIAKRPSLIASLYEVRQAVNDSAVFEATVAYYRDLEPDNELDQAGKAAALAFNELAARERVAVQAMVASTLAIFAAPEVARNTKRSSFDLAELREGPAPVSVYLTFSAHQADALRPLVRAFLMQVLRRGTEDHEQPRHRLLLALDDFELLGWIPLLESGLTFLAGHGIRPLLTVQSLARLERTCGEDNVWSRSPIRVVLPVNETASAAAVAKGAARDEIPPESRRVTAKELLELSEGEEIILRASAGPVRAASFPYYEDAGMLKAATAPSEQR